MFKNLNKYILGLIIVVAALLRLWNLGNVPPSLDPDEAALGYNAYSILKTGKGEYGKFMPIIFKSFGDFKPGLYVYLTVPSVAVLGLNEFSVRFPSAIAGIISVFLIYLVVKKLFLDDKLALTSAAIAAINPWSIFFSRGAWEVNVALCLTLAGIYFFLKSLEKQKYIIISIVFFSLTLITYQGAKLSTGVVLLILGILYWRNIVKHDLKNIAASLFLGLIIAMPIILSLFQGTTGRLNVFNVFSYPRPKEYLQTFLNEGGEKIGSVSYYLYHSEGLNFTRGILGRFFNHFSARFLFFEGDWGNPRHTSPYQGQLLLGDVILIVFGVVALIRQKVRKEVLFIWIWLFASTLPSILSRDQIHAVRALNMSVPLVIILAFGALELMKLKKIWIALIGGLYIVGFVYFLDSYFVHLPKHNSEFWQYGYKQMVEVVTPIQKNYKVVKVQQSFNQPYIYFLFYQKYDPVKYQAISRLVESEFKNDVGYVTKIDNIEFAQIDWSAIRGDQGSLVVADPFKVPAVDSSDEREFKLIKEIKLLNGLTAFRVVEIKYR